MATDWNPMTAAPKNATEVRVILADGTVHERAHWACDLSGSDQPPFMGWSIRPEGANYFREIPEPVGWLPIASGETTRKVK